MSDSHPAPDELHGLDPGELLARGLNTVKPSGGSNPWEPPTPEELAALLPQYRIESLLGHGGMGAVYKGTQAALDRPVAIKLLPAELAADADFIARFQREARTLAKLQHSSIVAVYDFGQTSAGHLYFVMEYVDGTDLQHILKGPGLKPEQAFVLIGQICEALHYAHQQGVIHRDIKPANILITKDGRAKVADFGLARPVHEETGGLTGTNVIMGTPDYMAPEQRSGTGHPDHRADIFALGVMLYEMLTGQRPHGAFQPPSQRVQVDVRIDEVVLKALQQEPARRYQQASEMKQDVERIRTTPPTPVKPKRSKLLIAAAVIISIIVAIISVPILTYFLAKGPAAPSGKSSPKSSPAATAQSALPWQTLDRTSPQWDDKVLLVDGDGWIEFKTTGEKPHQISLTAAAPPNNPGLFRDTALRVRYRWNPQQRRKPELYLSARNRAELGRAEAWLTGGAIALDVSGGGGVNRQKMLPQPLKLAEEGLFELAVIGQRMLVRLNGQVIYDEVSTGLNRTGSLKVRVQDCLLRDIEHVNLDGIADPLKALGWEAPDAQTAVEGDWRDFMTEWESSPNTRSNDRKKLTKEKEGWRSADSPGDATLMDGQGRSLKIRVTARFGEIDPSRNPALGTPAMQVHARRTARKEGDLVYGGSLFRHGAARLSVRDANGLRTLNEVPALAGFNAEQPHTIELQTEGDLISFHVDGIEVASVRDTSLPPGGGFGIGGSKGVLFEKAEYRFLEELTAPQARTASAPQATAEAKKRLVEARAHLKAGDLPETRKLVETALATAPGELTTQAEAALILAEAQALERAAALAQEFVAKASAEHPQFAAITELRVKLAPTIKQYEQHLRTAAELVGKGDDAGEIRELKAALALVPDGKQAADKLAANPLHVGRPLPGRKFANELGHTFVPVDGLPNVLFSIWETRVKDFEQFVKETGYDTSMPRNGDKKELTWQKPGFEQTGDHPVVVVSRRDANAFCRWLTEKERAAGRLLPGQVYRLPTDREWSAAMGVLDEPGDFPADRMFPADVFTWGKGTPQPHNAENMNGKNDDFRYTAPVGSGRPNHFGLYDMMGNVTELCADLWSFEEAKTVLRGFSYGTGSHRAALQDNEGPNLFALPHAGFRCVLDFKTEEQRRVQLALEEAVKKLTVGLAADHTPYREVHTLVNDEMVLLDASRGVGVYGPALQSFADIPVTHYLINGPMAPNSGRTEAMKKWPLRLLSMRQAFPKEDYLESVRGQPLQWVLIHQHEQGAMSIKSLAPLAGMKLKALNLENFKHLENLEPLRGMPLETLRIQRLTPALDFAPVKDAPLRKASLPEGASLETILTVCGWWGERLQTLGIATDFVLATELREPALAGDVSRVQKLVSSIESRLKAIPYFQGKMSVWTKEALQENLKFAPAAAKWLSGDRAAFDGLAQNFNGHTYLFVPWVLNYDDSKAVAEKLGAHLVTITTPEESAFINQCLDARKMRGGTLGLDRTGEGRMAWKWVTGEPLDFHNWGSESGMAGDRAYLTNENGKWVWFHGGKTNLSTFIIEWDTPTPQPPPAQ